LAATSTSNVQAASTQTTPSIVSTPSPFKGRHLSSRKNHHASKPAAHSTVHHAVKPVSVKRKSPSVRIAKHR
jgi:hypothetical protein